MSSKIKEFVENLANNGETKMSLCDFFKNIHQKFYSNYDISFSRRRRRRFAPGVFSRTDNTRSHHEKLIEYGIVTSNRSSNMKQKLDALELVENIDYSLLPDVWQNLSSGGREVLLDVQQNLSSGGRPKKIYLLTPEAFKKCLMRAQRRPKQKVDPVIYCDYYLLLEKTYKLYTDYEKKLLSVQLEQQAHQIKQQAHQLEQKDQTIEQKDHQLEQKSQQLESQKHLVLRLNEMLIDSSNLPKTQVVYIATSSSFAKQNRFKVGGVESLDKLESRLCTYNSRSSTGDPFYYADWFLVHSYKEIENRLKDLLGRFREQITKEMYVLNYTDSFDFLIKIEIYFQQSSKFKTHNVYSATTTHPKLN